MDARPARSEHDLRPDVDYESAASSSSSTTGSRSNLRLDVDYESPASSSSSTTGSRPHHRLHSRSRSGSPVPSSLQSLGKNVASFTHGLGLSSRPNSHHRRRSSSNTMAPSENEQTPAAPGSKTLQDRIFARVLQQVLPSDYPYDEYPSGKNKRKADRAPFSLATMSANFNKFNARIGVVFVFQHRVIRMLQWQDPVHTLSAMAVYTFICLDPYLLAVLPLAVVMLFVMVPAFMVRHPPPPSGFAVESYNARGAATAPAAEVTAVQEMSKDFFRNLRDLQNTMGDFTLVHDQIIHTFGPFTNFSDEKVSSALYIVLFFTSIVLFVAAHLVPWRFIFLVVGWFAFAAGHPTVQQLIDHVVEEKINPNTETVRTKADDFAHHDITLNTTAETREVEIFELQRRTSAGEYEPWIFSCTPYEPLSAQRIANQRPVGTRFFEDVRCPPGWEWLDGKWTMDLGSLTWVQERFVNGVEVEEEGERWVYDYTDGKGRGEWRRRRWVRGVKRRYLKRGENA